MEKLQVAIEKARQSRARKTGESQTAPTTRKGPPAAKTPTDALWMALQPLELQDADLVEHRVVSREAGQAASPFDILRTKVLLQMRQNGWKRLAITSPMPRSGKTTMACNLALGLGRQRELRSILLDLDLRDPDVHRFFNVEPRYSIGQVLSGDVEFADHAQRIGDNVACAMGRYPESDPTRLLLAEETADVIDRIEELYKPDVLIFDLPSVLVNDDTRAFLKNVDCALIVLRANRTRYAQFDTCEREVAEQTNVLGVVLNACTTTSQSLED